MQWDKPRTPRSDIYYLYIFLFSRFQCLNNYCFVLFTWRKFRGAVTQGLLLCLCLLDSVHRMSIDIGTEHCYMLATLRDQIQKSTKVNEKVNERVQFPMRTANDHTTILHSLVVMITWFLNHNIRSSCLQTTLTKWKTMVMEKVTRYLFCKTQ
jgi:hypothetical protein